MPYPNDMTASTFRSPPAPKYSPNPTSPVRNAPTAGRSFREMGRRWNAAVSP